MDAKLGSEIPADTVKKAREAFDRIPYVQLVGMRFDALRRGEAVISLEMRDELRQPHGLLHGGATASLVDTATAFAVITMLAPHEKASTVDLNIHYLRPVSTGEIVCTAKIVKAGRRLLTVSAEVVNEDGRPVATALTTYAKVG